MAHREVKFGERIKLRHVNTGKVLHSHPIHYTTGSHHQEVTGFGDRDNNDWWIVKQPQGNHGHHVESGSVLRLEHSETHKYLHHDPGVHSPSSHQGEVSAVSEEGPVNEWILEIEGHGAGTHWHGHHQIRLIHVLTGTALHSHDNHTTHSGQQEITVFNGRDINNLWEVEEIQ